MRRLTIERTAFIILFALLFALATRVPVDTDVWWHIRSGEYTLTQGMIYADPFSFTKAGTAWTNHSWGAQIILYAIWQVAGSFGLAIYTSALATLGMWFVYRMSSGSVYLRAFAIVLGAATAAVFWSPRPQMLSFALSAALLYILYWHKYESGHDVTRPDDTSGRRITFDRLWLIPPLMALWGNLHAGFSIGFILLAGSIAGEIAGNLFNSKGEHVVPWRGIRKLALVTLVSAAAIVINPYGLNMLAVPFQTVSIGALQNFIQEWNTPNFHERQNWPFIALLLGLFGAVGASRKQLDWTDFLLTAGTAFMGLLAGRNVALFAVVATPVLTRHLDAMLAERGWVLKPVQRVTPRMARLNALIVALIGFAALAKVLLVLDVKTVDEAQREFLPIAAVEHMQSAGLAGPLFNSYNWGGYLIYALPDEPVFVDGRTDLYGDTFLTESYFRPAQGAAGWRDVLAQYSINTVLVEAQSGLARALREEAGWRLDYEDEMAVIFVRAGDENG
ncbi:MAG: hypothetical protein JNJ61_09625 [Anaerolineae bacterium]|nr:hypothetical protein [Anaerolineae bacterium]